MIAIRIATSGLRAPAHVLRLTFAEPVNCIPAESDGRRGWGMPKLTRRSMAALTFSLAPLVRGVGNWHLPCAFPLEGFRKAGAGRHPALSQAGREPVAIRETFYTGFGFRGRLPDDTSSSPLAPREGPAPRHKASPLRRWRPVDGETCSNGVAALLGLLRRGAVYLACSSPAVRSCRIPT